MLARNMPPLSSACVDSNQDRLKRDPRRDPPALAVLCAHLPLVGSARCSQPPTPRLCLALHAILVSCRQPCLFDFLRPCVRLVSSCLASLCLLLAYCGHARAEEGTVHLMNEPTEYTDVIDAFDDDDPFDLNLSVGFLHELRTG